MRSRAPITELTTYTGAPCNSAAAINARCAAVSLPRASLFLTSNSTHCPATAASMSGNPGALIRHAGTLAARRAATMARSLASRLGLSLLSDIPGTGEQFLCRILGTVSDPQIHSLVLCSPPSPPSGRCGSRPLERLASLCCAGLSFDAIAAELSTGYPQLIHRLFTALSL